MTKRRSRILRRRSAILARARQIDVDGRTYVIRSGTLGDGSSGDVYKVEDLKAPGSRFALKVYYPWGQLEMLASKPNFWGPSLDEAKSLQAIEHRRLQESLIQTSSA